MPILINLNHRHRKRLLSDCQSFGLRRKKQSNMIWSKSLLRLFSAFKDNTKLLSQTMLCWFTPLPLQWLYDENKIYESLEKNVKADSLFIIDPNNPTGFTLFAKSKKAYQELLRFAKDKNKLLLLDFCFASFMLPDVNLDVFDLYELLEESGVSYVAIEDTGKTWPVQDTKAALIKCSKDIYPEIYNIHTSYLLNVSPFILNLLTEYILDSEKDEFASVYDLLERNRNIVAENFKGSLLELQEPKAKVS